MDVVAFGADDEKNNSLIKRSAFTATSNVVDIYDQSHTCRHFFPGALSGERGEVKIKLMQSKDAFCIMSADKRVIVKSIFFVRKVKLSASVVLVHAKALENGTAKYLIRRVVCKTVTIPGGYRDVNHEKLFLSASDSSRDRFGR